MVQGGFSRRGHTTGVCPQHPTRSRLLQNAPQGERQGLCNHWQARHPWGPDAPDLALDLKCASCGEAGGMRPDVVWFGEMPYHMEQINQHLGQADLFISIGTSGNVYPAAGFVAEARNCGAHTVELNLEPSEGVSLFREVHHGKATDIVPMYVDRLLQRTGR
jgi:NAD-dependent deacetylase